MSIQSCINTLIGNLPGDAAIISPGSRNAPVIFALNHQKQNCYSVVDERSAGFVALGIAKFTRQPVILSCTSGTAVLNYYPAIAEAYYARVPLIVITADRPPEQIDTWEGQAIRQKQVFQHHIRASFETPSSYDEESSFAAVANSVKSCLEKDIPGPIHINVPIREPFYAMKELPQSNGDKVSIELVSKKVYLSQIAAVVNRSFEHKNLMIFHGMEDGEQIQIINDNAVVLSDITANKNSNVAYWDAMLFSSLSSAGTIDALKGLKPDILITTGTTTVSKGLKRFLSIHQPEAHYHISQFNEVGDLFNTQPQVLNPHLLSKEPATDLPNLSKAYLKAWSKTTHSFQQKFSQLNWVAYHEFAIVNYILSQLNAADILHLSNSMPVRYASFLMDVVLAKNTVYSNRGTSGIDGCTSTALGTALATDREVYLITGDLAFFYDINGLFNQHIPVNLKIIVLNNAGGGIFNMIAGPENLGAARNFQTTPHAYDASHLAHHFGMDYFECNSMPALGSNFSQFKQNKKAALLEVKTSNETDVQFFESFKQIN